VPHLGAASRAAAAGVPGRDDVAGSYDELSMGMSGDLELAIEYGATTVRVGQAIFGPRLPPDTYWLPT